MNLQGGQPESVTMRASLTLGMLRDFVVATSQMPPGTSLSVETFGNGIPHAIKTETFK